MPALDYRTLRSRKHKSPGSKAAAASTELQRLVWFGTRNVAVNDRRLNRMLMAFCATRTEHNHGWLRFAEHGTR
jgi:hypothetical protein